MASKSTISIGFKQEDAEGGFKKLTLDADALRQVMNANVTEAEKLGFRREEARNANAEYKDMYLSPHDTLTVDMTKAPEKGAFAYSLSCLV